MNHNPESCRTKSFHFVHYITKLDPCDLKPMSVTTDHEIDRSIGKQEMEIHILFKKGKKKAAPILGLLIITVVSLVTYAIIKSQIDNDSTTEDASELSYNLPSTILHTNSYNSGHDAPNLNKDLVEESTLTTTTDTTTTTPPCIIDESIFYGFGLGVCNICWKNDGYCDFEQNTPECDYDGGDCIYTLEIDGNIHLCEPHWLGDGFCDFSNNIEECEFDGGDCDEFNESGCIQEWIGDELCDHELNTELCDFDGGDCDEFNESGCNPEWICDEICYPDFNTDTPLCNFDVGDCKILSFEDSSGCYTDCIADFENNVDWMCDPELNTL